MEEPAGSISMRSFRATSFVLSIALVTSSCSQVQQFSSSHSAKINCIAGGIVGATLGAGVGAVTKGDDKAIALGAIAGGAAGCALAMAYKSRLDRLEQIAARENVRLQTETLKSAGLGASDVGIVAQVEDQGMFPTGSAELSAKGRRQVTSLAEAFVGVSDTAILVVGHTDATGSAELNQALSERRAKVVARILEQQGIAAERLFFQGAGSSRPVADNSDPLLRGKNRRVEIVEVDDRATLMARLSSERNNPKYLSYGTSTRANATRSQAAAPPAARTGVLVGQTEPVKPTPQRVEPREDARFAVDFGGVPVSTGRWELGSAIAPKSAGFSFIPTAHAADMPVVSCDQDLPRKSGEAVSLASGDALETRNTTDYLPGYNNRVWAQTVHGHLVTISPVSILRDSAAVGRQPLIKIVEQYSEGNRNASFKGNAIANTYEGESRVLYRVFLTDSPSPVSCLDVVFSKGSSQATDGVLIYPDQRGESYTAKFVPLRT